MATYLTRDKIESSSIKNNYSQRKSEEKDNKKEHKQEIIYKDLIIFNEPRIFYKEDNWLNLQEEKRLNFTRLDMSTLNEITEDIENTWFSQLNYFALSIEQSIKDLTEGELQYLNSVRPKSSDTREYLKNQEENEKKNQRL